MNEIKEKEPFEFGDKVKYCNREAIFLKDNSSEYDYQSKMALIVFATGDTKSVRFSSIKKWCKE